MALLEVEDLKVHFFGRHGVARAVDGVSFTIDAGEVVGLVGESGSGKSVTALAILRILARGGRIAGEPTTALDVTVQAQILALLHDLQQQLGMAVLLITHDMGILAESTDRMIVMYAGQIVEQASTMALFAQRLHPYTEALLACVPRLDSVGKATLANIPGQPPNPSDFPPGCRFAPRCHQARPTCKEWLPVLESPLPARQVACFYPLLPTMGSAHLATVASREAP